MADSYMTLRVFTPGSESPLLSGKTEEGEPIMTMSKPTIKVAFALLLTLILIIGIYTTVQGAFLNAGTRVGQAHVDAGLNADLSHARSAPIKELQTYMPQSNMVDRPHGCHSENFTSNPDDY